MSVCEKCGTEHKASLPGRKPCVSHRRRDGVACTNSAMIGQTVCAVHGGKSAVKRSAGLQKVAEAKARSKAARWGVPIVMSGQDAMLGQVHRLVRPGTVLPRTGRESDR